MLTRSLCFMGLAGALMGCSAAGGDETGAAEGAQVVGTDGRVAVAADGSNVREQLRASLGAYARVVTERFGEPCSAVHFGNGLLLTAGSCVSPPGHRTPR